MKESLLKLFATDKDLYDIMISAQQRLTRSNMLEIGKGRRTFFFTHENRDDIIEYMSLLIYDYDGVLDILERRESSRRSEKNTSITIPIELTASEIKEFVSSFNDKNRGVENMTLHGGAKTSTINPEYTDYDFSKTRLAQKTPRNASLVLEVGEGKTVIRLPSTEKSRSVVTGLHSRIESIKKKELPLDEVSLSLLATADERSTFFTKLISEMDKFVLEGVTSLKVAAWPSSLGALSDDGDDEELGEAAAEMMAVVRSVAISGENLVASR
ncbi:hypothetical protein [Aureimonas sp. Leaf454]|uniref:hypothetical protein n=1 Tax=Aureimonas sp. Leaf454 TaxID=1736381 RepID=UPI000A78B8BF|nr:hypothetical protein [Aureimonas sp. Leaf454]